MIFYETSFTKKTFILFVRELFPVFFLLFFIFLVSCNKNKNIVCYIPSNNDIIDTTETKKAKESHLRDTVYINGSTILVLRPDSIRYHSKLKNVNDYINEIDSDFGFSISIALDSFELKNVEKVVTESRFVKVEDCKNCPLIIDRDSVNYGLILTSEKQILKFDTNVFGSDYYLKLFVDYFGSN